MAPPLNLVFIQQEIDKFDSYIAELRSEGRLNRDTEKAAERAFKDGNQGVSIGEARRAVQYQEDEPVDDAGGRVRQAAQGLTYGLGDEAVGLWEGIKALGPGGVTPGEAYSEGQGRSKAGVEQFRRENPYEAMALETLGSVATLPLGGFALGKAGLTGANLLSKGLTHGSAAVRGATKVGQAGLGALASPSRTMRGAATAVQGAASGGLLGQDYDETGTGAIAGGVIGGALGISPLGTRVASNIRRRSGDLLAKESPSALVRGLPERVRGPVRQFAEKRMVTAQPGEEMAQVLAQGTGRSRTGAAPDIFGNDAILPVTGGGSTWLTAARKKVGNLLDRGKTQEGLLSNTKDKVRRAVYAPLDDIYGAGGEITEGNIGRVFTASGRNIEDFLEAPVMVGSKITKPAVTRNTLAAKLNARRTGNLTELQNILKQIQRDKHTVHLLKPKLQRLVRGGKEAVTEIEATPIGFGREAEVVGEQINPRFVVEFVESLKAGKKPSLKSLQAFRNSLRKESEKNSFAKQFEGDLDRIMNEMFPGLDQADDMFRQASAQLDAFNLGRGRTKTITFDEIPDFLQGNKLSPLTDRADESLQDAVTFVRNKATSSQEGDRLVANFLDGVFHKEVIGPLLTGSEAGTKIGRKMWDVFKSDSGKVYLQQFFGTGRQSEYHLQQALKMMELVLNPNITRPQHAQYIRRLKQAVGLGIAGYIGFKIGGGLLGGSDTSSGSTERFD